MGGVQVENSNADKLRRRAALAAPAAGAAAQAALPGDVLRAVTATNFVYPTKALFGAIPPERHIVSAAWWRTRRLMECVSPQRHSTRAAHRECVGLRCTAGAVISGEQRDEVRATQAVCVGRPLLCLARPA